MADMTTMAAVVGLLCSYAGRAGAKGAHLELFLIVLRSLMFLGGFRAEVRFFLIEENELVRLLPRICP